MSELISEKEAKLVEWHLEALQVTGSNPVLSTKVNNESVGDTVRNNIEAECANHSLIRSGSLCGSNYSHVAILAL